jgi:hypothetical protein
MKRNSGSGNYPLGDLRRRCRLLSGSIVLAGIVGLLFSASLAFGQGYGTISGNITDPTGALVPGATVTATETGTGFARTINADASGHYVIPNLRPTQYDLTVEAKGFEKSVQSHITLLADQAVTMDFKLVIGSSVQSVNVAGAAPLVNTTTATLSDVVGQERMVELPLNGREASQLINLVAGASGASPTVVMSQSSLPGSVAPTINGSRTDQTSYLLDGANYLDNYYNTSTPFPFPDALEEFSVQTQDYSTRYGENSGGVVNVVTKGGTNDLHGDAFEFVRNDVFNARNFFAVNRDPLQRNQFGGTIGGPVYIPHLYNGRDKTFFFFGYQGMRYVDTGTSNSAFVPTQAELQGNFTAVSTVIDDPLTGRPFTPNNVIPTTRFDKASLGLEKFLPQPASSSGQVFYYKPNRENTDEYIARVDEEIGSKDRIMVRYFRDHAVLQPQSPLTDLLGYSLGYDAPAQNWMGQETHAFRSNLINQASFSFNTIPILKGPTANSPNAATFGVTGLWLPTPPWIQSISISGEFSISGGARGPFNTSDYGGNDNLSWVHGRHNVDLGFVVDHGRNDLGDLFQSQGSFSFSATTFPYSTNYALASFLLGSLNSFTQGFGEFKNDRNMFYGFYGNDSYHATRRLTINFGIRYEPYLPWKEIHGRVEQFSPANFYAGVRSQQFPNAPAGLRFPGDPGMPYDGVTGSYDDFAPRVGFAYDLTGDGKTSVRGGFGSFYDTRTNAVVNNRDADITPFSPQLNLSPPPGPFSDPVLGYSGYPFPATYPPASTAAFPPPVLVVAYDPSTKYKVPVTYQWDLTVERELRGNWMLQVAYVGSEANHAMETIQLNPSTYIPGSTLGTNARALFLGYSTIGMASEDINGNFNALEVTLKKRMSKNLTLNAAYTYSKSLDDMPIGGDGSSTIGADTTSTLPWFYPGRHQMDYGPSANNIPQRAVVSYVWMLPTLSAYNRVLKGFLGNWEWDGIVTAQSGNAITITAGQDKSQTGLGQDRAVYVPGQSISNAAGACGTRAPCVNFFNPSAFVLPATGTFGDTAKDSMIGPSQFTWDMGVFKNIPLKEQIKLQFRAEFFNVFNRVNFNGWGSSKNAGGFGTLTGANDPRIGQLALKLIF